MLKGYLKIIRPANSIAAGLAVLLGVIIATGNIPVETLPLIAVVFLITGAGNVINDWCDSEIDAINRPDRPIPSGAVSKKGALIYSAVLFAAGIAICLMPFINPLCLVFAVINSAILILYAKTFKGQPLIGNICVSYLAASIFLFGGASAGIEGLIQNTVIAAITFFAMLSRELLKDAEDIEGDRAGGAKTLPMIIGVSKTGKLCLALAGTGVLISLLAPLKFRCLYYLILIAVADAIILYAAAKGARAADSKALIDSKATTILKAGMFLATAFMLVSALLF